MTHVYLLNFDADPGLAGTLVPTVCDATTGVALASQPAYTIVECDEPSGFYLYRTAAMPDGQEGAVIFRDADGMVVAGGVISPTESEQQTLAQAVTGRLILPSGTVASGVSTTEFTSTDMDPDANAGAFDSQDVLFTSGLLYGERRTIATHTKALGTHTLTLIDPLTSAPITGVSFEVI